MTNLEIILTVIIYLAIGLWICFKREWYDMSDKSEQWMVCMGAIIFMPINLLVVLFCEFINREWKNY